MDHEACENEEASPPAEDPCSDPGPPRPTPGPWEVTFSLHGYDEFPPAEAIIHAPERREEGCVIAHLDSRCIDWDENAYLITAAPDLAVVVLHALMAQGCQIDSPHSAKPWETMALTAFRKARLPGMEMPGGCYHCLADEILEILDE